LIENLPPLRDVIEKAGLKADKKFGQNFLLDLNITQKIVRASGLPENVHTYEVGPGPGGLTRALLLNGNNVHAIEMDTRTQSILDDIQHSSDGRFTYSFGDALVYNWSNIDNQSAIIANLPYNVATPLILNWLKLSWQNPASIERMALMVQKEVADRICATPDQKTYGRLSVMCQWLMDVSSIITLPPKAFTPAPKVHSSVVLFIPRPDRPKADFKSMERVVASAFNQRRKMIRTSLKSYAFDWDAFNIDSTKRAENLTIDEYVQLSKALND